MATYVFSDIHGIFSLWNQIRNFLRTNDTAFFLGDAADRGTFGWQIIKEMLNDSRIIYLKGNHEQLLINAVRRPNSYDTVSAACANGGFVTLEDACNDPEAFNIVHQLMRLPTHIEYITSTGKRIFLSHSGSFDINNEFNLLWDRKHFNQEIPSEYDYVIHGHTPIPCILEEIDPLNKEYVDQDAALFYGLQRNKICVDCGSCWTGVTTLLNLDTFEEHIFYTSEVVDLEENESESYEKNI